MTEKEDIRSGRRSMESIPGALETPSSMHSSNGMKADKDKLKVRRTCVPPYEVEMLHIVGYMKTNPHITLNELALSEEKLFNLVLYLMRKPMKNQYELHVIRLYLYTLPNFIGILSNRLFDDFNEILTRVAYYIQCECLDKDSVLFRVGDKGDKFYILLSGKLAILVAKDVRMRMDEQDYVKHLLKLKSVGENEILTKTIQVNRHIYPVDEENFDEFLNTLVENQQLEGVSDLKNLLDRNFVLGKLKTSSSLLRKSTMLGGFIPSSSKNSLKRASNIFFLAKASLKKGLARRSSQIGSMLGLTQKTEAAATGSSGLFSVDDYLNFTKPEVKQYRRDDDMMIVNKLPEVTLWQYHNILTLKSGDTFGEVALELSSQKRTATIISTEECVLGSLSRDIYNDCIREANEKARRSNIAFILNSQIFKNINKQTFEKKQMLNLFINCKFRQGDLLFDENTEANFLYLIKDGEYQVYMNKSIHDINVLIKEFGGNPEEELDRKLFLNEIAYNKFIHTKHKFRISSLKDKDVVGLSDYVFNNKYYCRVQCNSSKGEAFKLSKQFYDNICQGEKVLKDNYNEFVSIKKKILLEKLLNFKKIRISCFKDMNDERRELENLNIVKASPNNEIRKNQIFIKVCNFKLNRSENERDKGDQKSKRDNNSVSPNKKRLLNFDKETPTPIALKKLNLSERPEFFIRENTQVIPSNHTKNKNSSFIIDEEENKSQNLDSISKPSQKFIFHGHQNSKITKISAFSELDELILDRHEMNQIIQYNLATQAKEGSANTKPALRIRKKSSTNHNLPNLMKTIDMVNTSNNESSSIKILEKEDMKFELNTSQDTNNQPYEFENLERISPERVKFQNGVSTPIDGYAEEKIIKSSPSKLKGASDLKILLKSFNLKSPTSGGRVPHQGNYINYTRVPVSRSVKKKSTQSQYQTKNTVYNSHTQTYQSTQTCQTSTTPTASSTVYKNNMRQFYHVKKNSYNKSNMMLNYSTSARDKEILNNIIDKMVFTNKTESDNLENYPKSKSKPKKIITHMNEVPMIDCLVLDRVIENSQINQNQINTQSYPVHSSIYYSNPNSTNGFKDYNNFRLPDTPNTVQILPFTSKNKTAPIKLYREKINLREKNNILMTNRAKQLFSFASNKKLKNYSHLIDQESSASENFYFNENLTATAHDKNFRPKKYKLISPSRHKHNI
jgi:CRP-like cAMP-binding protein